MLQFLEQCQRYRYPRATADIKRLTKIVGPTLQSPEQIGIRHVIGIDNGTARQNHLGCLLAGFFGGDLPKHLVYLKIDNIIASHSVLV